MGEDMDRDEIRRQTIVGVEKHDEFPGTRLETGDEGGELALVGFMLDDRGALRADFRKRRRAPVGRGVVDHEALDERIALRLDRFESLANEAAVIEVHNNDADQWQ